MVVIDNYDSFVYNLVQYLGELGAEPVVHRHDASTSTRSSRSSPTRCSCHRARAGPRTPACPTSAIRAFGERGVPVLGVCLGHQCIGQVYGGRGRARAERDARQDVGDHARRRAACSPDCRARSRRRATTRWSSTARRCPTSSRSPPRARTAWSWGCATASYPIEGVQFHPESILTESGHDLLRNFLALVPAESHCSSSADADQSGCRRAREAAGIGVREAGGRTGELGEAVGDERARAPSRRAGRRGRAAAQARPARSPRRWRNEPSNAAWARRGVASAAARLGSRTAAERARRAGGCAAGGTRVAPRSMSASRRSRPRSGRPTSHDRVLRLALGEPRPSTRSTTRRMFTSTAGTSASSAWQRTAPAVYRPTPGSSREVVGPTVGGDHAPRRPRAAARGAGSRAGPTPRSPRPGRRRHRLGGRGTAR